MSRIGDVGNTGGADSSLSDSLLDDTTASQMEAGGDQKEIEIFPKLNVGRTAGSMVGAVGISGLSVVLYFITTSGQSARIVVSGVATNFLINTLGGKKVIDALFPEKSSTGPRLTTGGKVVVGVLTVAGSIPTFLAAYSTSDEAEALKVTLASMAFLGNLPLYGMAFSGAVQSLPTAVKDLGSVLAEWPSVICGNGTSAGYRLKGELQKSLRRVDKNLMKHGVAGMEAKYQHHVESKSDVLELVEPFIDQQGSSCQVSCQTNCNDKFLVFADWFNYVVKKLGATGSAVSLAVSSTGYLCNSAATLPFGSYAASSYLAWGAASFGVVGLAVLSLQAGWTLYNQIHDTAVDIVTGDFVKPEVLQVYQGWERLAILFVLATPIVVDLYSGYTSEKLYKDFCRWTWQEGYVEEFINITTVGFNGFYAFLAAETAVLGKKFWYGTPDQKAFLLTREKLGNAIKELSDDKPQKFIDSHGLLTEQKAEIRERLLATPAIKAAWAEHFRGGRAVAGPGTVSARTYSADMSSVGASVAPADDAIAAALQHGREQEAALLNGAGTASDATEQAPRKSLCPAVRCVVM